MNCTVPLYTEPDNGSNHHVFEVGFQLVISHLQLEISTPQLQIPSPLMAGDHVNMVAQGNVRFLYFQIIL